MIIYNSLIIVFFIYYTFFFVSLFEKNNRKGLQYVNTTLDEKRKVAIKTLKEQKEFLTLKYGVPKKWEFSWFKFGKILIYISISILLYTGYSYLLGLTGYIFTLWQVILILITGPIIINYVLKKFHLEQSDLGAIIKWRN